MNLWNETKSVPVSREMVWAAYKKVKANKGSAGVDQISMEEFDADRSKHLYKLWNRMASGSYFPPPVKEVEIAKKDGKIRNLGIPTIADRIGQMVIKDYLEPRLEKIFSSNSYGYRPNRNAHQALESVRNNCRKTDWVIDLDIKGFFDNIRPRKADACIRATYTGKLVFILHQAVVKCTRAKEIRRTGSKAGKRHTAGWSDKSVTGKSVSPLCHGQMV